MASSAETPQAGLTKAELRGAAIARRGALSLEQRAAAAAAVAARPLPFEIAAGTVVSGYWPIHAEIDPIPLLRALAARGARLALPVILARDQPLTFRAFDPDTQLLRGPFGIMQPSPEAPLLVPAILLVPLAAFDRLGHRIGYGAGHYDRSLALLRQGGAVLTVGLAFDVQEIAAVPMQPHDVALDYVLTETRLLDCRSL